MVPSPSNFKKSSYTYCINLIMDVRWFVDDGNTARRRFGTVESSHQVTMATPELTTARMGGEGGCVLSFQSHNPIKKTRVFQIVFNRNFNRLCKRTNYESRRGASPPCLWQDNSFWVNRCCCRCCCRCYTENSPGVLCSSCRSSVESLLLFNALRDTSISAYRLIRLNCNPGNGILTTKWRWGRQSTRIVDTHTHKTLRDCAAYLN